MRFEHQLIAVFALLFAFFLLGIGTILYFFPYLPVLQTALIHLMQDEPHLVSNWGIAAIIVALTLFMIFFFLTKRRYVVIRMGGFTVFQKVLSETAEKVLQSFFPTQSCRCDVVIRNKKKIEIFAHLPAVNSDIREQLLEEVEEKLTASLGYLCGWRREFLFHVSFKG